MSEATGYGFENTDIGYLIQSDEPTPEQWADMRTSTERSPERRLLLAVLDDAIRCYIEYQDGGKVCRKRTLFDEAEAWIFSQRPAILSFDYVCGELGINPEWLRQGLEAARAGGMRKVAYRENPVRGPKAIAA